MTAGEKQGLNSSGSHRPPLQQEMTRKNSSIFLYRSARTSAFLFSSFHVFLWRRHAET
jgi:hypothetical protein